MRNFVLVGFLAASLVQEQAPVPPPSQPETETQALAQNKELTIPAGTRIQVTLSSPIRTRGARRGDAVHAATAFPVALNGQVAIPAGTYLEGALEKVLKRGPSGGPGLQMHFTRIVFASGYTVSLQKATAVASNLSPIENAPAGSAPTFRTVSTAAVSPEAFGPAPQQPPPTLTPPPMPGPHIGTVVGIGLAVTAAGIIGGILWTRHLRGDVIFDVGSPFEVVLDNPLTLEMEQVAAADASSPAA
jgi:type IV secretion system protein VirB10